MKRPNVILSGPFCTGKTTLMLRIAADLGYNLIPDHTTRTLRQNEPYIVVSKSAFEENRKAGLYFEPLFYNGNWYGFERAALETKTPWVIDIVGHALPQFKKAFPNTISFYLEPPTSREELIQRAHTRGDSDDEIAKRLKLLEDETSAGFDYLVPGAFSLDRIFTLIETILSGK